MKHGIIANSVYSIADQGVGLLLGMALSVLLARSLGAETFGKYSIALTIVGVVAIFSNFGVTAIINREIARFYKKAGRYIIHGLWTKLVYSLPITIAASIIAVYAVGSEDLVLIIALISLNNTLLNMIGVTTGALTSLNRNDLLLRVNFVYRFGSLLVVAMVLRVSKSLPLILFMLLMFSMIAFLFSYLSVEKVTGKLLRKVSGRFANALVRYSFPITFASAAEYVNLRFGVFLVGVFISEKASGYYNAAYSAYLGATLIPLALTRVFFVSYARIADENLLASKVFLSKWLLAFFAYAVLAGGLMYVYSGEMVNVLYGHDYSDSGKYLSWLSIILPFVVLNRLSNYSLLAIKQNHYYFKITLLGTVILLVSAPKLMSFYGPVGMIMSLGITESLVLALGLARLYILNQPAHE